MSDLCVPLPPDRPLWFPGSSAPEWLDGSLPGDFGFDPLGLGMSYFHQAHKNITLYDILGYIAPTFHIEDVSHDRTSHIDSFYYI